METIERSVVLPTSVDEAWRLVTDPAELAGWLGREVDLVTAPGASGRVVDDHGTTRHVVVTEAVEGSRISWTWWPEDGDALPSPSDVTIRLAPTDEGTRVIVTETLPSSGLARAQAWAGAWSHRLLHLEALVLVAAAVSLG